MAINTGIEWCDSTVNAEIGCDGCELWDPGRGVRACYAGSLVERYGGSNSGFPDSFDQPLIKPKAVLNALNWPDLRGQERPGKPHLNGYPRLIFFCDMGDPFTESLPTDWLDRFVPAMEADDRVRWLFLTKRPARMRAYFARFGQVPKNFWLGTTVTKRENGGRIRELLAIEGATVYFVSYEPIWGDATGELGAFIGRTGKSGSSNGWVIAGGESEQRGQVPTPFHPAVARLTYELCQAHAVPFFFKQHGAWLHESQLVREHIPQMKAWVFGSKIPNRLHTWPDGTRSVYIGKRLAGHHLDGREWHQMPEDWAPYLGWSLNV